MKTKEETPIEYRYYVKECDKKTQPKENIIL